MTEDSEWNSVCKAEVPECGVKTLLLWWCHDIVPPLLDPEELLSFHMIPLAAAPGHAVTLGPQLLNILEQFDYSGPSNKSLYHVSSNKISRPKVSCWGWCWKQAVQNSNTTSTPQKTPQVLQKNHQLYTSQLSHHTAFDILLLAPLTQGT